MDESHEHSHVSAFAFDIIREAFRKSVRNLNLPEERWTEHARSLVLDFTGREPDQSMIDRIIGR